MENVKIEFEDFDKGKIAGTYTRLHYGNLKVEKLKFPFVVYEVYLSEVKYHTFSMNFIESVPDRSEELGKEIINQTKQKLNLK